MTDYTIKTKEIDVNVAKYQCWLIVLDRGLILKRTITPSKQLEISDLTLESESLSGLIEDIEKNWNILCSMENLASVYKINSNTNQEIYVGYVLRMCSLKTMDELIGDKKAFEVMTFDEFDSFMKGKRMTDELKEAYLTVLSKMMDE